MLKAMLAGNLLTALLLGAAPADDPPPVPAPGAPSIEVVTVNGTGCHAFDSTAEISPDRTSTTVDFGAFEAMVGLGTVPTDARKTCQLALRVHPPAGYTYALGDTEHLGSASIAAGASAVLRQTHYFLGRASSPFITHNFTGPLTDDFDAVDTIDLASREFAQCGVVSTLLMTIELRMNAGTSDVRRTTSSVTLGRSLVLPLDWRRC